MALVWACCYVHVDRLQGGSDTDRPSTYRAAVVKVVAFFGSSHRSQLTRGVFLSGPDVTHAGARWERLLFDTADNVKH